ncbi:UNVERIFIED_CONTAM: hypothetical protein RF653_10210 [Kocuria sp. CPCC 205316]|uniref:hypothetical protein n=1 Tax=Kocuria TaxID=57493 RepID=UPI0036DB453F
MTTDNTPAPEPQRYVIVGRDFSTLPTDRLLPSPAEMITHEQREQIFAEWVSACAEATAAIRGCDLPSDEYLSPDASSVRFSEMNEEAEAEMAEWDAIIKGKRKKPR